MENLIDSLGINKYYTYIKFYYSDFIYICYNFNWKSDQV